MNERRRETERYWKDSFCSFQEEMSEEGELTNVLPLFYSRSGGATKKQGAPCCRRNADAGGTSLS